MAKNTTISLKIEKILRDPILSHAHLGMKIVSLEDEETLYELNSEKLLVPASNLKSITAAAALEKLRVNYRFKTEIYASDGMENGIVKGDLIVKGFGDPTLTTRGFPQPYSYDPSLRRFVNHLEDIVKALRKLGLKRIYGNIVADDTFFDHERYCQTWSIEDQRWYYAPRISGLSINENLIALVVKARGKVGEKAKVSTIPKTKYPSVVNQALTVPETTKPSITVEKPWLKDEITIKGTIRSGTKWEFKENEEWVTVENPCLYTASVFKEHLEQARIHVGGRIEMGKLEDGAQRIMASVSPPLSEIINWMLKESDNFYAEQIIKTLGAELRGEGSWNKGVEVINEFLRDTHINYGCKIVDGSGLSRENRIPPELIIDLLKYMKSRPAGDLFISSLPIAGVDGTIKRRMKGTLAERNLMAKTGYLERVSCLSGYLKTKNKKMIAFSMMFNDFAGKVSRVRAIQDKIGILLASSVL